LSNESLTKLIEQGSKDIERPDMDKFVAEDLYSQSKVNADKQALQQEKLRIRAKIQARPPHLREVTDRLDLLSSALEIIVFRLIELYNWMGDGTMVAAASPYDDIINGVDAIIEFTEEKGGKRIALAVDVAMQNDPQRILKKLETNIQKLLNPTNPRFPCVVEYFESQRNEGERGRLENIIHVVIGADQQHTQQFIALCIALEELKRLPENDDPDTKREREQRAAAITKHPLQVVFLEQIRIQLRLYQVLLAKAENPALAIPLAEVNAVYQIIEGILKEKKVTKEEEYMKEDHCFAQIADMVARLQAGAEAA